MTGILDRIRGFFATDKVAKAEQAAQVDDPVVRERMTEDYEEYRDDVAAGRGTHDVYEEFQGDQRAPEDPR